MLYDEGHPHIKVFSLMVLEAVQHSADQIILTRKEDYISAVFSSKNDESERDQIGNHLWHSIVAAIHCLAGETVLYNPNDDFQLPDTANSLYNSILISDEFPAFQNSFLTELRQTAALPLHLELSFTNQVVTITIHQTTK